MLLQPFVTHSLTQIRVLQAASTTLAEALRRAAADASARASAETEYQSEITDLQRGAEESLKRERRTAAMQMDQAQDLMQEQIAAAEQQAATEVEKATQLVETAWQQANETAEARVQAARVDAEERISAAEDARYSLELRASQLVDQSNESARLHAAAMENMTARAEACAQAEANAVSEIERLRSELTESLDLLDQRDVDDATTRTICAEVEEEAIQWKQSAEESFAATLTSYRDQMESTLKLAREEAHRNAQVASEGAAALARAERRAARKVRRYLCSRVLSAPSLKYAPSLTVPRH